MIEIRGAREHNLKSVDVDIPLNKLTLVTGVSGSGKSSLVIDTLYAESNRRYFENLSIGSSKLVQHLPRPNVDLISGTLPSVGLLQAPEQKSPRETLASFCEIYDDLRLIYSREGFYWSDSKEEKLEALAPNQALAKVLKAAEGRKIEIHSPLSFDADLEEILAQGFSRVSLDDEVFLIDEEMPELSEKREGSKISVVVDRIKVVSEKKQRILEALEAAYKLSDGSSFIRFKDSEEEDLYFSSKIKSEEFGGCYEPLSPHVLSFNSPKGACPACSGIGSVDDLRCSECGGSRLNFQGRSVRLSELNFIDFLSLKLIDAASKVDEWLKLSTWDDTSKMLLNNIQLRLQHLIKLSLEYLTLNTSIDTLSSGEFQRLRIARTLTSDFKGILYLLDEPSRGLDPASLELLIKSLRELITRGNTVLVVDHKIQLIESADHIIDIGPGAGAAGGQVVFAGSLSEFKSHSSTTAKYISGQAKLSPFSSAGTIGEELTFSKVSLKDFSVDKFKLFSKSLNIISGPSGSGKSLLAKEIIYPLLAGKKLSPDCSAELQGNQHINRVKFIESRQAVENPRSTVATLLGVLDDLRSLYAQLPESKKRGWDISRFSYNTKEGRCSYCEGRGEIKTELNFLAPAYTVCEICQGARFAEEVGEVSFKGVSISDAMNLSIQEAAEFYTSIPGVSEKLNLLVDAGLSYLKLGQAARTLSGGEKQRIDLVKDLKNFAGSGVAYIVEEPSAGLHLADLEMLLQIFYRLIDQGSTVILLDHDPDLASTTENLLGLEVDRDKNHIVVNVG